MTLGKFDASSRYAASQIASYTKPDGVTVRYLRRRFIAEPSAPEIGSHSVSEGDRLDRIAVVTLGDPALWWRIADTNRAFDPAALTAQIGRRLRIATDPAGPQPEPEPKVKR
jgi:nucleoid-associated protein YgaU